MLDRSLMLSRLAAALSDFPDGGPLAWRLGQACRSVFSADGVAITMSGTSTDRVTVCSTNETARHLEDLQEVLGEGPSIDAYRTGRAVRMAMDTASGARWPLFLDAVRRDVTAGSLCSLPMRAGAVTIGVVSMYGTLDVVLREPVLDAMYLCDAVGSALLHDPGLHGEDVPGTAWSNRATVHQATGMVVAELGVSVEDALALLRAHAFAAETDLEDIADRVVRRELRFSERPADGVER